ncbi:hypothetical protein [Caudoviricetes sp.]|nr:hypothetical protein [Caudoviricetes sp.]
MSESAPLSICLLLQLVEDALEHYFNALHGFCVV